MPRAVEDPLDIYFLQSDTVLARSILECARLKPVAAFSIPQSAPTSRMVGDFLIPAGSNFVVDTHALNIRNPFWGDDSTQYRPERFVSCTPSQMRYHYWRYGFGPRQCLGKYLVDLIIKVIVVHLVEDRRLSFTAMTHWDKNPESWIAQATTDLHWEQLER